jgi:hypothetical protein
MSAEFDRHRAHLLELIRTSLGERSECGGEVFSSGIDSLKLGSVYVLGLNPGMGSYCSIIEQVSRWTLVRFSAFRDQCWSDACWKNQNATFGKQEEVLCPASGHCKRGKLPHQVAVLRLLKLIAPGLAPEEIFATNAVFVASRRAYDLPNFSLLWEQCWLVHRYLLGVVRPQVVLCLGYGKERSSFSLLRSKCSHTISKGAHKHDFKWFDGKFPVDGTELHLLVVGVFHPSYGYRIKEESALRTLANQRVGSNSSVERDALKSARPSL